MTTQARVSGLARVLIFMIRVYQRLLSPWLGQNCRFYPSCSQYAIDALRIHGAVIGSLYAVWRILRCQPLCKGGDDPVPPKRGRAAAVEHSQSQ